MGRGLAWWVTLCVVSVFVAGATLASGQTPRPTQTSKDPDPSGGPSGGPGTDRPEPDVQYKYYLRAAAPCGSDLYLALNESEGAGEHSCGSEEPSPDEPVTVTYTAKGPLNASVMKLWRATAHIWVLVDYPERQVVIRAQTSLGAAKCTSIISQSPTQPMLPQTWREFTGYCSFNEDGPAGQTPSLALSVSRLLSHRIGQASPHSSYIEFGADPVPPPAKPANTTTPAPPTKKAQGAALPLVVVGVVAAMVVLARRPDGA